MKIEKAFSILLKLLVALPDSRERGMALRALVDISLAFDFYWSALKCDAELIQLGLALEVPVSKKSLFGDVSYFTDTGFKKVSRLVNKESK